MRILYVAKHDAKGNCDEEAISHALEQLGHIVIKLHERDGSSTFNHVADFMLCHHWRNLDELRRIKIPKVFWCFDLIDSKDPTIAKRDLERINWITQMTNACDLGFMTDGDWVGKDKTGKLLWLMQGADERIV